ncbi:hypothetical protein KOAAANKH_00139 [Brevundimonas sp. NIBR10]|nr:hypothetical protein KOAAANKH_00139 [Brevundimonas sp. NIBR10]
MTSSLVDAAFETIRTGAPGLSEATCRVLAGIIARKFAAMKGASREDLARIIDPEAWAYHDACPGSGGEPWTAPSLAKVDRILALQGGAGA